MRLRVFSLSVAFGAVLAAAPAQAQFFDAAPQERFVFGKANDKLTALLELQYQMQLLKRLIEREKMANNMIEASLDIGVSDPVVPLPDRDLCAQVPANIPCAKAYDDLYPGFLSEPVIAKLEPIPAPAKSKTITEDEAPASVAAAVILPPFYWTDITCMAQKCSAVISPNPADPRARYRVIVGEKLPDGAVIQSISAQGVTLKRGETETDISPAPKA